MTQSIGLSKRQLCNQLVQQLSDMLVVVDHQIQTVRLVSYEKKDISDQLLDLMIKKHVEKESSNTSNVVEEKNDGQPVQTIEWAKRYQQLNDETRQLTHEMADCFVEYKHHIQSLLNIFKENVKTIEELEDLTNELRNELPDKCEKEVEEKWDEMINKIKVEINDIQEGIDKIDKNIEQKRKFSHMFGDIVIKNT
ncbi:uncharacterized protein LOC128955776 [Oppia nitens]|uniref:uncharacterized protein LOC128955776 n=1 Tax=Oppia nitens TaxID=1686743 RepID=UPI0023DBC206|nr:uncharacterized protein LOC128955776 [Oppia nitens]